MIGFLLRDQEIGLVIKKKGDFTIDGDEYTVYKNIRGDLTQYCSLCKTGRSYGTIDVSAHFDKWEELGMTMGTLDEVKVLAEIGNGNGGVSGTVKFPYAKVYVGSTSPDQGQISSPTQNQVPTPKQNPTLGQNLNPIQNPTPLFQGKIPPQNNNIIPQNPVQGQNEVPGQGQVPPQNNNFIPQNPVQEQNFQGQPQNNNTNNNSQNALSNGEHCAGEWAQCGGQRFNGPTCYAQWYLCGN
ncbi:glycoside hydrolase family 11 protein [Piromyces sp. E2]|nr:glycoside hydrolase family 11 protein [Piromyces sp. E2]|eukprot:OUM58185.1 glycoside hydrolase family 11 protein [Piromyces sp. E2]